MGWLPADRSDFVDRAGRPAPLWHVVYGGGGALDGDGEDLEEFELEESVPPPPGAAVGARAHDGSHGAATAATARRAAMGEVRPLAERERGFVEHRQSCVVQPTTTLS